MQSKARRRYNCHRYLRRSFSSGLVSHTSQFVGKWLVACQLLTALPNSYTRSDTDLEKKKRMLPSRTSLHWMVQFLVYTLLCVSVSLPCSAFSVPSLKAKTTSLHSTAEAGAATTKAPEKEIDRRRNLAIISHPDSGKTTMTEKLLLYGGALQQAGAVRQKAEQRATQSDFMEMEQQRGISISSTVMNFDYNEMRVNILDTPGHQDFSEDTYRALAAADNAVMLLDAAKGLEPQTRKLFEVCRMRRLPLFTFCNKMDRPALTPYEIMDQIETEFNLESYPVLWPIGDGDR